MRLAELQEAAALQFYSTRELVSQRPTSPFSHPKVTHERLGSVGCKRYLSFSHYDIHNARYRVHPTMQPQCMKTCHWLWEHATSQTESHSAMIREGRICSFSRSLCCRRTRYRRYNSETSLQIAKTPLSLLHSHNAPRETINLCHTADLLVFSSGKQRLSSITNTYH
jgi:hypothetical protein